MISQDRKADERNITFPLILKVTVGNGNLPHLSWRSRDQTDQGSGICWAGYQKRDTYIKREFGKCACGLCRSRHRVDTKLCMHAMNLTEQDQNNFGGNRLTLGSCKVNTSGPPTLLGIFWVLCRVDLTKPETSTESTEDCSLQEAPIASGSFID